MLKLYRLMSQAATGPFNNVGYNKVRSAIVWACSEDDAVQVLAEAFEQRYAVGGPDLGEVGYLGIPANPYVVTEVCKPRRGLVMAEGQDG